MIRRTQAGGRVQADTDGFSDWRPLEAAVHTSVTDASISATRIVASRCPHGFDTRKRMIMPVTDVRIYQIKITLKHTEPPVWRRFQVRGDVSFYKLHRVLQIVMGWDDYHLHQFVLGKKAVIAQPDQEFPAEFEVINERKVILQDIVTEPKKKLIYEYDLGDGWEHELLFEKIQPADPQQRYPVCLEGAMACPPEDSGSPWGYYEKLKIMKDPTHPEHAEIVEWMGGDFDPTAFDLAAINTELKRIK